MLVSEELEPPYHRPPLSKAYLKDASSSALHLKSSSFYANNNIQMELGVRVVGFDAATNTASLSNGRHLEFNFLALTVGARARRLPGVGAHVKNVFYLRSVEDAQSLRSASAEAGNIVVIGAGFIGLEVASALAQQGKRVTVIESASRILARAVAPEISEFLQAAHARHGVSILTARTVKELIADGDHVRRIVLEDGVSINADLVVVGIGSTPNTELAAQLGLVCDNGIVVDASSRTSRPNVFAAGDCTHFKGSYNPAGIRLESVQNATDQARVAAAVIAGLDKSYEALPWFWSDQYNLKLQMAGLSFGATESVVRPGTESEISTFHFRGDTCICVESVNRPREHMAARRLLARSSVTKRDLSDVDYDISALLKR